MAKREMVQLLRATAALALTDAFLGSASLAGISFRVLPGNIVQFAAARCAGIQFALGTLFHVLCTALRGSLDLATRRAEDYFLLAPFLYFTTAGRALEKITL